MCTTHGEFTEKMKLLDADDYRSFDAHIAKHKDNYEVKKLQEEAQDTIPEVRQVTYWYHVIRVEMESRGKVRIEEHSEHYSELYEFLMGVTEIVKKQTALIKMPVDPTLQPSI